MHLVRHLVLLSRCDVTKNAAQLIDGRQRGWTAFPDALDDMDALLLEVSLLRAVMFLFDRSPTAHMCLSVKVGCSWDITTKVCSDVALLSYVLRLALLLPLPCSICS